MRRARPRVRAPWSIPADRLEVARFSTSLESTVVERSDGVELGLGVPESDTSVLVLSRFGLDPFISSTEHLAQRAWLAHLHEVA